MGRRGLAKGTASKKDLVDRLQQALPARSRRWLERQPVEGFGFEVDEGIDGDTVKATLVSMARLRAKKPGGDVLTIKLYPRTVLGHDEDLCDRLDQYARCWSLVHSRATVMMELLTRRVVGDVSEDPECDVPLWTNQLPSASTREGRRLRHLLDVLCEEPRQHNSFLSQLVLPEYRHHAPFERDYLLQELFNEDSQLWGGYNRREALALAIPGP
mmetsp:Transcript_24423/g.66730  ORF Transcript_24423/g.66730 Transcript_24423/m.66730 type:complete len:214 (-) Transcript_24423:99-740(-)